MGWSRDRWWREKDTPLARPPPHCFITYRLAYEVRGHMSKTNVSSRVSILRNNTKDFTHSEPLFCLPGMMKSAQGLISLQTGLFPLSRLSAKKPKGNGNWLHDYLQLSLINRNLVFKWTLAVLLVPFACSGTSNHQLSLSLKYIYIFFSIYIYILSSYILTASCFLPFKATLLWRLCYTVCHFHSPISRQNWLLPYHANEAVLTKGHRLLPEL